jgi:hypothetical protein
MINKRKTQSQLTRHRFHLKKRPTTNDQQFSNITSCGPMQINSAHTQLLKFERKKKEKKKKNKIQRGSGNGLQKLK